MNTYSVYVVDMFILKTTKATHNKKNDDFLEHEEDVFCKDAFAAFSVVFNGPQRKKTIIAYMFCCSN